MRELIDVLKALAPIVFILALFIFYAPDPSRDDKED